MDDILESIPSGKFDELTAFLNHVDQTGDIKFTHKQEENNKLPMLDVLATAKCMKLSKSDEIETT